MSHLRAALTAAIPLDPHSARRISSMIGKLLCFHVESNLLWIQREICPKNTQTHRCGDGIRAGPELCDDGSSVNGDGCSSTCALEPGWTCTSTPCGPTTCSPVCGDGRVVGNEQCDAGPGVAGCSSTCTVQCGYECSGGSASAADTCVTRSPSVSLCLSVCLLVYLF